jgi:hypothetical protein
MWGGPFWDYISKETSLFKLTVTDLNPLLEHERFKMVIL